MADFNITVSNNLRLFGVEPSTKWGEGLGVPLTMVWGTALWGYGYTTVIDIEKVIGNAVTVDSAVEKYVDFNMTISNQIVPAFETSSEQLKNGDWNYVFPDNTTDGEERDFANWSVASDQNTSYTSFAASSTSWT